MWRDPVKERPDTAFAAAHAPKSAKSASQPSEKPHRLSKAGARSPQASVRPLFAFPARRAIVDYVSTPHQALRRRRVD
jgi:hypothetical protein